MEIATQNEGIIEMEDWKKQLEKIKAELDVKHDEGKAKSYSRGAHYDD